MKYTQIAIDGPAGAGKSTIAKLIAKDLKYSYVDTGAMYRGITLKAMSLNIDLNDESKFDFIKDTTFHFKDQLLFMDNLDVSKEIRETKISNNVSLVSSYLYVREELVKAQQRMALENNVVMDGRDIGYHVLPNADFKFFLTASIKKRAERRYLDNMNRGIISDLQTLEEEIARRDYLDTTREHNPLRPAEDAIILDTSNMTIEEVVKEITKQVKRG